MPHGDAIVDRDGVEFLGDAAGLLDFTRDQLAEILEVDVAGHELRERVYHGNDRLSGGPLFAPRAAGAAAAPRHVAAVSGGAGTVGWHGFPLDFQIMGSRLRLDDLER